MTEREQLFLRCEFGAWARARKALGRPYGAEARHALYVEALGYYKSSRDFTTAEANKVLAKLRVWSRPDDLNAQLKPDEDEAERRAEAMDRCLAACWEMYELGDNRLAQVENQRRYIAGTARNVVKKEPADCTAAELNKVLGCLLASVRRRRAANPAAAASIDAFRAKQRQEQPF